MPPTPAPAARWSRPHRTPTCCAWIPPTPPTISGTRPGNTATPPAPKPAAWPRRRGVRRLWLTHYSAAVTDPAEGLAAAQAAFPAAEAGFDGKRLELNFDGD